jgi:hypothetical protein
VAVVITLQIVSVVSSPTLLCSINTAENSNRNALCTMYESLSIRHLYMHVVCATVLAAIDNEILTRKLKQIAQLQLHTAVDVVQRLLHSGR